MATPLRMATNLLAQLTNSGKITMISTISWAMSGNGLQICGKPAILARRQIALRKAGPIYATSPTAIVIAVQHVPKILKTVPRAIWDSDVQKTRELPFKI